LERNSSLKIDSEMAERENRNSSLPLEVDAERFDPEANTILPNDLLIMMEEYKNDMFIIDIRPREWFDNEQMKTDVLMLNIEQYTLLTCHNPSDFTMLLCLPTRSKFHSLASVRFIILLDFAFDPRDAQQIETWSSTLQHLKQILPSNCQSALLKVLVGGWLNFGKLFPDQVMHVRQDDVTAYDDDDEEDEYEDHFYEENEDDNTENDENHYVEEEEDHDDSDDQNRNDNRRYNNVANTRYNNYAIDDDDSDNDAPHNSPLILRRGRTERSSSRGRPRGVSFRGRSRGSSSPMPRRIRTLSCIHHRYRNSFYRTCALLPSKTVAPLRGRRSIFPGLVNYKGSCSVNSVISCLYASVEFRNYIVHHWSRSLSFDFKLLREFCKLIYEMRDRSVINIIPDDSLIVIGTLPCWPRVKRVEGVYQVLLHRLHDDFERQGLVLNSSSDARGEITTIIEQLFMFSIFERTTYTCCGMVEVGSPMFTILLNLCFFRSGSAQTLEDSLERFRNSPSIHHNHGVACPRCKTSVPAVVETRFSSLPPYLVINVDSYLCNVSFPMHLEDPLHIPLDENGVERTVSYKLYAVVECIKKQEIVHYVSVCRDSQTGDWFYLDGHEIKEVACDYQPKKPCLLFYEKCHPDA
ncbi:Ubiquitin carboxyl-terminal hydrolase 18, partial [Trichinella patagoniensis]